MAWGPVLKFGPSPPENRVAEKVPTPTRPGPLPEPEPPVFADGSVIVTLSNRAAGENLWLDVQEVPAETAPVLPFGYSPPIRMFRITMSGPGKSRGLDPGPYAATITVLLSQKDFLLTEGDPYRLVVQRYDESASAWKETPSSVDLPWLRVETTTDALGLFAATAAIAEESANDRKEKHLTRSGREFDAVGPTDPEKGASRTAVPMAVFSSSGVPRAVLEAVPPPASAQIPTPTPTATRAVTSSLRPATVQNPSPAPVPATTHVLASTSTPTATATPTHTPTATATATPSPTPTATATPSATPTPTPTPTATPSATLTPTPTRTATPTATPFPSYRLFINGRQVLSRDTRFHVPLGVVTISNLPGADGRYQVGSEVNLHVDVDRLGSQLRITGADSVNGPSAGLRVNERPLCNGLHNSQTHVGACQLCSSCIIAQSTATFAAANSDAYADTNSDAYADTYTYADYHSNIHTYTYADYHSNIHTYTYADFHSNIHTYTYADFHSNIHTYTYADFHSNTHAYAHGHADTECNPCRGKNCLPKRPGWKQ